MTLSSVIRWYQPLALRTENPDALVEYYKMGFIGELGELLNLYKKDTWHGKKVGVHEYIDEIGDVFWYGTVLLTRLGEDEFDSALGLVERWVSYIDQGELNFKQGMSNLLSELWYESAEETVYSSNDSEYVARILTEVVALCGALRWDVKDVLEKNVEKLRKRFPSGFVNYENRNDLKLGLELGLKIEEDDGA